MKIPIHRLLFRPTLSIRADGVRKGAYGECFKQERIITLDPRGQQLARTFLHELLHLRYPQWSETKVRIEERKRWKRLTWKDKAQLYQAIGKGLIS